MELQDRPPIPGPVFSTGKQCFLLSKIVSIQSLGNHANVRFEGYALELDLESPDNTNELIRQWEAFHLYKNQLDNANTEANEMAATTFGNSIQALTESFISDQQPMPGIALNQEQSDLLWEKLGEIGISPERINGIAEEEEEKEDDEEDEEESPEPEPVEKIKPLSSTRAKKNLK